MYKINFVLFLMEDWNVYRNHSDDVICVSTSCRCIGLEILEQVTCRSSVAELSLTCH